MRRVAIGATLAMLFVFIHAPVSSPARAQGSGCVATPYSGLTAARVNPGNVYSDSINATGCDIGIYYSGTEAEVSNTTVHGARYFGIMVHGDNSHTVVDILDSDINTIGDNPQNGNQRGVAVYYRAFFATGSATGRVSGNHIWKYQKGGIVVNGPGSNVQVQSNEVEGYGPISWIAQNGIQFGYGSSGSAMKNTVSGHAYTGPGWASGGILVVGGAGYGVCPDGSPCPYTTGIQITRNTLVNNDVGAFLSNWGASTIPEDKTNVKVVNNVITHDGSGQNGICYQAGVSVVGNNDKVINDTISGLGYTPGGTSCSFSVSVDADPAFSTKTKVHAIK